MRTVNGEISWKMLFWDYTFTSLSLVIPAPPNTSLTSVKTLFFKHKTTRTTILITCCRETKTHLAFKTVIKPPNHTKLFVVFHRYINFRTFKADKASPWRDLVISWSKHTLASVYTIENKRGSFFYGIHISKGTQYMSRVLAFSNTFKFATVDFLYFHAF